MYMYAVGGAQEVGEPDTELVRLVRERVRGGVLEHRGRHQPQAARVCGGGRPLQGGRDALRAREVACMPVQYC